MQAEQVTLRCPECESTDLYGGWDVRAYGDVVGVDQEDGARYIEQQGDWDYGDAGGVDMVSCSECGWVVEGEYLGAWVTGDPVKVTPVVDLGAAADALAWARTALTDPGALPDHELADYVEESEQLDRIYAEAAPSPLTLYAVAQLDFAINLLRTDGE